MDYNKAAVPAVRQKEQTMSDSDMRDEFRQLGDNLQQAMNAAWQSSERKRLQQELKDGLQELEKAFHDFGEKIKESEVGMRVKADMEDLGERVRSGEVGENTRQGVISALQRANAELVKLIARWDQTDEDSI
jgi:succinate dehydrogenase/fumarate reductase flavoprotein subunit